MRRKLILGVIIATLIACPWYDYQSTNADDQKKKSDPSIWMQQKLSNSQEILNGLATEDYDLIRQRAQALTRLNKIEAFVRQRPEGYRVQLQAFQYAVKELERNAEAKNLDGAAFAFNQMTSSCINCHRELRKKPSTP